MEKWTPGAIEMEMFKQRESLKSSKTCDRQLGGCGRECAHSPGKDHVGAGWGEEEAQQLDDWTRPVHSIRSPWSPKLFRDQ